VDGAPAQQAARRDRRDEAHAIEADIHAGLHTGNAQAVFDQHREQR